VSRRLPTIVLLIVFAGAAAIGYSMHGRHAAAVKYQGEAKLAQNVAAVPREIEVPPVAQRVPSGNFMEALERLGLTNAEASGASAAAQRAFNLRQVRAGNTISVARTPEGALREIDYKIDGDRLLKIVPDKGAFSAEIKLIPSTTETSVVSGQIEDSLFGAVQQSGENRRS